MGERVKRRRGRSGSPAAARPGGAAPDPRAAATRLALAAAVVLALAATAGAADAAQARPARIVTASSVALRSAPRTTGTLLRRLDLGTHLEVLGSTRGGWIRVRAGRTLGWIAAAHTARLDRRNPAEAFRPVVARLTDDPGRLDFARLAALERALVASRPARGEDPALELLRLEVVGAAASRVERRVPRNPDRARWVRAHQGEIMYYESGGTWQRDPRAVWRLWERNRASQVAEEIAWQASRPAGVECEDDTGCWLRTAWESRGRYLRLYKRGAHAAAALADLHQQARIAAGYACDGPDARAPDARLIADIRRAAQATRSTAARPLLADLDRIERACRGHAGPPG
ncbi:MAG TPA: SH3 domain-containing protein [Longimicrobiales bacterium]|nr:SH3 domain-containing protein [Longimicrobiales bacterium]